MGLWKKQPEQSVNLKEVKVEIVAHKRASKKQILKVKQANQTLNSLFEDNNFTVKLVLAARKH